MWKNLGKSSRFHFLDPNVKLAVQTWKENSMYLWLHKEAFNTAININSMNAHRFDIQLKASELSWIYLHSLAQSGFRAPRPSTHLLELRILGSGGVRWAVPWKGLPSTPKRVKRRKKSKLRWGQGW